MVDNPGAGGATGLAAGGGIGAKMKTPTPNMDAGVDVKKGKTMPSPNLDFLQTLEFVNTSPRGGSATSLCNRQNKNGAPLPTRRPETNFEKVNFKAHVIVSNRR